MPVPHNIEFALTDPRSKHFQETMTELQELALLQEQDQKIEKKTLLTLLREIKLEKVSLLEEQQALKEARNKEYLRDYAAFQEKEHEQAVKEFEALKSTMDSRQLSDHLNEQRDKLEEEVGGLQIRLENLQAKQTEIKANWKTLQNEAAGKFATEAKKMDICVDGEKFSLTDIEAKELSKKVFSDRPDPIKEESINAAITSVPPDVRNVMRDMVCQLNLVAGARDIKRARSKLPESSENISPQAITENQNVLDAVSRISKEGDTRAKTLMVEGQKNGKEINEAKKQLDAAQIKLEAVNEARAEFAPRPKPRSC